MAGILFYGWGEPVYVFLMMLTITIDYTAGRLIDHFDENPRMRLICMIVSVTINLGILAVFKYNSFFVNNVNWLLGTSLPDPQIALPIGISFYTFQSMSYTIDMYLRNIKVQKNYINYATYVTLFPQIVAGPIVRYEDVQNEINERKITINMAGEGISLFIKGLCKKILLANNVGALWAAVKATPLGELSVVSAWFGILAFTFQIYFDFAGYSDMACGMGQLLGFHFPQNFNLPYISRSISEFWRRWHITLGSWFRSYVYIPLGGNRHGLKKTIRNLLIVWILTGMWHGASWNFILWGLYFGVLIVLERLFLGKILERLPKVVSTLYTFLLVMFGWVLFEFDQMSDVGMYFKAMFGLNGNAFIDQNAMYWLVSYGFIVVLCALLSSTLPTKVLAFAKRRYPVAVNYAQPVVQILFMLLCTAYLVDATYNPFLYYRF